MKYKSKKLWNAVSLSHYDPRTNQCELEVQKIIHLQEVAYRLPDVFKDVKTVTKSHIYTRCQCSQKHFLHLPSRSWLKQPGSNPESFLKTGQVPKSESEINWPNYNNLGNPQVHHRPSKDHHLLVQLVVVLMLIN